MQQNSSRLIDSNFIPGMPTISDLHQREKIVYDWLTIHPNSKYFGKSVNKVISKVKIGEARQHLLELIIINDKLKSNLTLVSELASNSASLNSQ